MRYSKILMIGVIGLCAWGTYVVGQIWNQRVLGKAPAAQAAPAAQVVAANTQYPSPTPVPSNTPVPSPTIGYAATIAVAQSTADEARRINAEVTAQHEAQVLSQLQLTAAQEQRALELARMTAQAAPTIYPMTQTQQAALNAQIATGQAVLAGQLTATFQAPTQRAAMVAAEIDTEYLAWSRRIDLFAKASIGLFAFVVSVLIIHRLRTPDAKPVQMPSETVIQMRQNTGAGTWTQSRVVVPCTPEQMTELAEMVVNGEKRFGINRIESTSRTFRGQRNTLMAVRELLAENGLAIRTDDGLITLNERGEEFFARWFEEHNLPDAYEFAPEPEPEQDEDPEVQELTL